MSKRITLSGLILGLVFAGGAITPSTWSEPPTTSDIDKQPASQNVTLVGIVEVDETKLVRIAARVKSRIDKLHFKITGATVKKGDPLADWYSPDLLATAQSLLDAQRSGNRELERIARDRLQRWGMDNDQVEEILKSGKSAGQVTLRSPVGGHVLRKHQVEGNYVEEGASLFDVADLSTVWVEAEVKDDAGVPYLKEFVPVRVTTKAFPNQEFSGKVLGLFQDAGTRRLKVRFAIKNPRQELLPGMLATVLLDVPAAPPEAQDSRLKALLKERLATLRALAEQTTKDYQTGRASFDRVHQAMRALLHAELELCDSDKERIAVLERIVAQAKEYEKRADQRYKSGAVSISDALMAVAGRLEAEIALERAKAK
ncbi:MAG: efflux RND transporter periplasmic adaptor subunit [Gemmataceae bacterium]|nr:efflux RND transporter periplasmic adaptor subunit [Gemmataceae bacterium]